MIGLKCQLRAQVLEDLAANGVIVCLKKEHEERMPILEAHWARGCCCCFRYFCFDLWLEGEIRGVVKLVFCQLLNRGSSKVPG